jgi:hypothetical protein
VHNVKRDCRSVVTPAILIITDRKNALEGKTQKPALEEVANTFSHPKIHPPKLYISIRYRQGIAFDGPKLTVLDVGE